MSNHADRGPYFRRTIRTATGWGQPILRWVAISVVVALQLVNAFLASSLSFPEWRSLFGTIIVVGSSFAPLLGSLSMIQYGNPPANHILLRCGLAVTVTVYSALNLALLLYRRSRHFTLDVFFLWYNLSDAYKTLVALERHTSLFLLVSLVLLFLHSLAIMFLFDRLPKQTVRSPHPQRFRS